jgi:YebC/PmpR family DNA-binding regulatory protein
MSGHSKWSKIKRYKEAADAKKGKVYTKLIKELTIAARIAGGDPSVNPRLRKAIQDSKVQNMPNDNIERAIKKGTGEIAGGVIEEYYMEGYGPAGVALLVQIQSDNRNRTLAEIRHIFQKHAGNLGSEGCVAWMFDKKGFLAFDKTVASEDLLMEVGLDAGADDVRDKGDQFEVITSPQAFENVKKAFDDKKIKYDVAEVSMIPQTQVPLNKRDAETMLNLVEGLEDNEDVQNVYTNADIPDEVMTEIESKK